MQCLKILDAWSGGGWGVFIALNHHIAVGEAVYRWARRTVRCAIGHCLVRQPRHPTVRVLAVLTVGALSSYRTGQSGAAPDRYCALSGAPLALRSDSAAHCSSRQELLQSTVARSSRCSGGTPDSPMKYSGARPQKPEGGKFEVVRPWAPDTVRCARPGFSSVSFAPLSFEP